jgi:NAD(P)-dependent dehydrogenase (short-subunit alcohol dehydrogenase family)
MEGELMNMELQDSIAVVTGAGRGIGLAIATALAREGARLVAANLNETEGLTELAKTATVLSVAVDMSSADGAQYVIDQAIARFGRVDILVNNVGAFKFHAGGFLSITDTDWQRTLDLNLMTTIRMARAVLPVMVAQGGGTIVNVSSVNARLPGSEVGDYSAAKAAVTNLTKMLSGEFSARGVRVNSVAPGPVSTEA